MYRYILLVMFSMMCGVMVYAENISREEVTPEATRAIQKGLHFLESTQEADGVWRCDIGYKLNTSYQVTKSNGPHVGVTSLASIAMMANGSLPNRGTYGRNVQQGLKFVLTCVHPANGYISKYGSRMYSHAFATLFLAEVYGAQPDRELREKLQKAVNLITSCQNSEGGWRYEPIASDADMSVTVCQVQALRAARNIGIRVPKKCIERAIEYIRQSATWNGGFKYQLLPMSESRVSFALTAAGVTALHGAGVYDDKAIQQGLEFLLNLPAHENPPPNHYFYYYGHYYAVQAMYIAGGSYWEKWYPKIRDELVASQNPDGSWEGDVGKNFATAVASIILQVPYRYLPIFQR